MCVVLLVIVILASGLHRIGCQALSMEVSCFMSLISLQCGQSSEWHGMSV